MKTKRRAIFLIILTTLLISISQLLLKLSSKSLELLNPISYLTNIQLIIALVLYAIAAILISLSLKWGELSVIYPFIALSFIWVTLLSAYFLSEHVTLVNWVGMLSICAGVFFIAKNGN